MRKLGVIGAGSMGQALISGALKARVIAAENIIASRRNPHERARIQTKFGVTTTSDNVGLINDCDVVLLAVKPQSLDDILASTAGHWRGDHIVISVVAGVTTSHIETQIGLSLPVIRAMPNTPALVGEGMSPFCVGRYANDSHAALATTLLASVGKTAQVDEHLLNPITATSGSGPAYFFLLMECMEQAAQSMGLPAELAQTLVHQTMVGAAKLVAESGKSAADLRCQVTSPGGTTAAALNAFDEGQFRDLVQKALTAANTRAIELGGD